MPACASFFRKTLESTSVWGSVRSLFDRYIFNSSLRGSSRRPKKSGMSSYPNGSKSSQPSTDSRTALPYNYVELHEPKVYGQRNEAYTVVSQPKFNSSAPHHPGITRMVELDVV
jgi:hypothetical protein